MGPVRDALENLKIMAHAFQCSLEHAADAIDSMNAKDDDSPKDSRKVADGLVVPGPKRTQ